MIESREKRGKLGKQRNQVAVFNGGRELQMAVARNYKRQWQRKRERERERERQTVERGSIEPNQKIQNLTVIPSSKK